MISYSTTNYFSCIVITKFNSLSLQSKKTSCLLWICIALSAKCTAHTIFVSFWFSCVWQGMNVLFSPQIYPALVLHPKSLIRRCTSSQQVSDFAILIECYRWCKYCRALLHAYFIIVNITSDTFYKCEMWTTSWALMGILTNIYRQWNFNFDPLLTMFAFFCISIDMWINKLKEEEVEKIWVW